MAAAGALSPRAPRNARSAGQQTRSKSWADGQDFLSLLKSDGKVTSVLPAAELAKLFDYGYYLRHVDEIFRRLGLDK
jgi:adenylosuccinate lyase